MVIAEFIILHLLSHIQPVLDKLLINKEHILLIFKVSNCLNSQCPLFTIQITIFITHNYLLV